MNGAQGCHVCLRVRRDIVGGKSSVVGVGVDDICRNDRNARNGLCVLLPKDEKE